MATTTYCSTALHSMPPFPNPTSCHHRNPKLSTWALIVIQVVSDRQAKLRAYNIRVADLTIAKQKMQQTNKLNKYLTNQQSTKLQGTFDKVTTQERERAIVKAFNSFRREVQDAKMAPWARDPFGPTTHMMAS